MEKESTRQYLLEMLSLFRLIQSIRIEYKGLSYGMEDLCERTHPDGPCEVMSVLSVWDYSETKLETDPDPIRTLIGMDIFAAWISDFILYSIGNSTAVDRRSRSTAYLLGSRNDTQTCPDNIEAIQSWMILKYQPVRPVV